MLAGSCGEKIAFYPYFAGGAGQGQDESLSLATSAALSSGAQHCLPLLTQSSLASRCVHTTNWLITMQLPAVCGWCRCMSNWMNEIFHRKIFVINYSEQLSLGHTGYVPRAVQPGGTHPQRRWGSSGCSSHSLGGAVHHGSGWQLPQCPGRCPRAGRSRGLPWGWGCSSLAGTKASQRKELPGEQRTQGWGCV